MDYGVLIRQLQGALGGKRVLSGVVSNAASGSGDEWSMTRTATGTYAVTYAPAFSATAAATVTPVQGGTNCSHRITARSATGFTVYIFDLAGNPLNSDFNFVAVG
jgi:hypothetical protein